jgi:TPR repeat protein
MQLAFHLNKLPQNNAAQNLSAGNTGSFSKWFLGAMLATAAVAVILLGSAVSADDEIGWLKRLAESGDDGAQLQVGLAYRDGRYGLTPDVTKEMYWIKRSAESGNAYAEDALGSMYAEGRGTEKNIPIAMKWWKKAMQDGNQDARIHMSESLIKSGHTQEAEALLKPQEEQTVPVTNQGSM